MKGHCKLCNNEAKLEESHIIPKFIFRWIKKTSATGYLRFAGNPNKREQDGIKEYWLCGDCEDRLEKWETVFSQEIFHPYVRDSSKRLGYGAWMLKFSTSLTWRALTYIRDIHGIYHFNEELMDQANQAEVTWRKFLLGEIPHPGKFQQHIIPLDVIDSHTVPNLPPNMNRYILRATDIDAVSNSKLAFLYCKLPKMLFIGFIHIERPISWEETKLHVKHGTIGGKNLVIPQNVGNYIMEQANKMREALASMSEKQDALLEREMMKDIGKTADSASFEAMRHDVRLSGKNAFK